MSAPVALISMPFASPHHPSLGLSLLQAGLRKVAIDAEIKYFFLDFVEFIGADTYRRLNNDHHFKALLGEWLFSHLVQQKDATSDMGYLSEILLGECRGQFSARLIQEVLEVRNKIEAFVDHCLRSVRWEEYRIVGFTSCFQQNMASLALAQRLKREHQHLLIVFGGANCEGEMGRTLFNAFKWVDVVVSGEADAVFPDLVQRYLQGQSWAELPGVFSRIPATSIPEIATQRIWNLDALPEPNYDEFFFALERFPKVRAAFRPVILFESARGCWWGAKKHCTFCGLNGNTLSFRSKTQQRAYEELDRLARKYGNEVLVVDNILDLRYFGEFLPKLVNRVPPLLMHYETKVNLSLEQIEVLAAAGVRKIQPGIESLSSQVLKLMDKGTTKMRNVQTLKLCAESGVFVEWGFLYGFPGESPQDYNAIESVVPLLTHLQPPAAITRVRADRFSPFFMRPEVYGIKLRPFSAYKWVYGLDDAALASLAYHFEMESEEMGDPKTYCAGAIEAVQRWHSIHADSQLYLERSGSAIFVIDTRPGLSSGKFRLSEWEAAILLQARTMVSLDGLSTRLPAVPAKALECAVQTLIARGYLLEEGNSLLSLTLSPDGRLRPPNSSDLFEAHQAACRRQDADYACSHTN